MNPNPADMPLRGREEAHFGQIKQRQFGADSLSAKLEASIVGTAVVRPNYPVPKKSGEFFHIQIDRRESFDFVGWSPEQPVGIGRWGRTLVWKIFGGNMEVRRVLRHGRYYRPWVTEVMLDIITPEEWIIEVKTGKGRLGFRQAERYTHARVENRYKGIFAVFVENPINGTRGPSANDIRLMEKFAWPHGRLTFDD